ncbi:hypothetical protein Glove_481g115 [Diversispora epigaea]|uniref:Uncharacterized protein n=1 Tax=Diversispora epigaea TaxID=1348612 RepID=A0A397GLW0_9GLOM|nr:hypothetical protein Glove_481g115 [Diversispora epigaea]
MQGKYTCKVKYTCEYIHNTGEICGRESRRPEGCHEHWRLKKYVPCKEFNICKKFTASACGCCKNILKDFMSCNLIFDRCKASLLCKTSGLKSHDPLAFS